MSGFTQLALRRTRRRVELGYPNEDEWSQEQAAMVQHLDALTRQTSKLARLVDELRRGIPLERRGDDLGVVPRGSERGMVVSVSNDEVLRFYDKLVLVLSEHTVASHWVQHEVEVALSKELNGQQRFLYPISLDKAVLDSPESWAIQLHHRSIADFARWKEHDAYQKAFTQLLRDLKAVTTPAGI